jgi:hypothetical protein
MNLITIEDHLYTVTAIGPCGLVSMRVIKILMFGGPPNVHTTKLLK